MWKVRKNFDKIFLETTKKIDTQSSSKKTIFEKNYYIRIFYGKLWTLCGNEIFELSIFACLAFGRFHVSKLECWKKDLASKDEIWVPYNLSQKIKVLCVNVQTRKPAKQTSAF